MTDQSDKTDASEGKTVSESGQITVNTSMNVDEYVGFSSENIREKLEDNEYALALILTSTRLENIVSQAIRDHNNWNTEKFEDEGYDEYTLGTLLEKCVECGTLSQYEKTLNKMRSGKKQVVSLRNDLVHEFGYLNDVQEDEDVQKEVEDAIDRVIEFIDQVTI
jgi:uncharacterized protein YutE (UPF0331/DUF86 family)